MPLYPRKVIIHTNPPLCFSFLSQVREQGTATRASIEALTRSVAELQSALREEREQRRTDLERLAASVVTRMDDLQVRFTLHPEERLREIRVLKLTSILFAHIRAPSMMSESSAWSARLRPLSASVKMCSGCRSGYLQKDEFDPVQSDTIR